jgi:hypothetical protein
MTYVSRRALDCPGQSPVAAGAPSVTGLQDQAPKLRLPANHGHKPQYSTSRPEDFHRHRTSLSIGNVTGGIDNRHGGDEVTQQETAVECTCIVPARSRATHQLGTAKQLGEPVGGTGCHKPTGVRARWRRRTARPRGPRRCGAARANASAQNGRRKAGVYGCGYSVGGGGRTYLCKCNGARLCRSTLAAAQPLSTATRARRDIA